jgi:hypothetical protein
MAVGSGRLLTDLMAGESVDVDARAYALARFYGTP